MGCAIKYKKEPEVKVVSVKKLAFEKPENWADKFYYKTAFNLKNPKIVETYEQLNKICKGPEFDFVVGYQSKAATAIKYKKYQVSVLTKAGFSKKVYVPKGICRELTLFKAPKTAADGQIRTNIKEMEILYIYNFGTYVSRITFRTAFNDVEFSVQ